MERTFDRIPKFDERSRQFSIRAKIGDDVERKRRHWTIRGAPTDQGREGACVGFCYTNELLATPKAVRTPGLTASEAFARNVYRACLRTDEYPGEEDSGTSMLAGAKVMQRIGAASGYRWAFGIDDVIDALCTDASDGGGPVALGINWHEGMYETRPSTMVEVSGPIVGGHAILGCGYHPGVRLWKESYTKRFEVVRWRNTWGTDYGRNGYGYIKVEDLDMLLRNQGEAVIMQNRQPGSLNQWWQSVQNIT